MCIRDRALIVDSWWDSYRGVISVIRVISGTLKPKDSVRLMATGKQYEVTNVGVFAPVAKDLPVLEAGEVGFFICNIKQVSDSKVGDTVVHARDTEAKALPGFQEVQQMVFAGVFPTDSADYDDLRDALGKLSLNDASFTYEPETSDALGFGFRLGFLAVSYTHLTLPTICSV